MNLVNLTSWVCQNVYFILIFWKLSRLSYSGNTFCNLFFINFSYQNNNCWKKENFFEFKKAYLIISIQIVFVVGNNSKFLSDLVKTVFTCHINLVLFLLCVWFWLCLFLLLCFKICYFYINFGVIKILKKKALNSI